MAERFDDKTFGRPIAGFRDRFQDERWEDRNRQVDSARERLDALRKKRGSRKEEEEAELVRS